MSTEIIVAVLAGVLGIILLYNAIRAVWRDSVDEYTRYNDRLSVNLEKKDNLYDYSFPELLKERYQKERGKSDSDLQLALKDWFSIFAGTTNRTAFYDFPSKEVDELWHLFILFTKDYREFCQKYLGQFLDPVPLESKNIEYPNLQNLYRTYEAVKNKNDCLLFKIDDMFEYKNRSKFQYAFMKQLEESLNKSNSSRTRQEGSDLYNYGLITYAESRATIPPEKPKSSATRLSIGSSGSKS